MELFNLECTRCRLAEGRTQVVPGNGPFDAEIMLIGEAPGQEEDLNGEPFVGGSGRFLNGILKDVGIPRSACYVTNIVKCRPPNNRPPEPDEISACASYVRDEIQLVKPQIIVTLGGKATHAITGKTLEYRGYIVPPEEVPYHIPTLITYHPSWIMSKQRNLISTFANDLAKIERFEHFLIKKEVKYRLNPTTEEVLGYLSTYQEKTVALDIETAPAPGREKHELGGLDPFQDTVIGFAMCTEEGDAIHITSDMMRILATPIKRFLEDHRKIIFQNNLFDRAFLLVQKGWSTRCYLDTKLLMKLIFHKSPADLDFMRSVYTNMPPYKKAYGGGKHAHKMDAQTLAVYNVMDADATIRIAKEQSTYLQPSLIKRYLNINEAAYTMFIEGVPINPDTLALHYAQVQPTVDRMERELYDRYGININSPKQLSELLYDKYNLPKIKGTSTDEQTLLKLKEGILGDLPEGKVLDDVLEYRGMSKIKTTYCEGTFNAIQSDGKVHPWWDPVGADTGRWACSNPNLMNQPEHMRDIVEAPPGFILMGADFSQLELRIAAIVSGEDKLLEMLNNGVDIHEDLRKRMEVYYPGVVRWMAKTVIFGTFYGRSAKAIAQRFKCPVQQALDWQNIFFGQYQKMGKFFREEIPKRFEAQGYLETLYGRRKYCETLPQAMNQPIQGTAGEICSNAILALQKKGFNVILQVHDQIVTLEPDHQAEERFAEFKEVMETASADIYPRFPAAGNIGQTWKEVK